MTKTYSIENVISQQYEHAWEDTHIYNVKIEKNEFNDMPKKGDIFDCNGIFYTGLDNCRDLDEEHWQIIACRATKPYMRTHPRVKYSGIIIA